MKTTIKLLLVLCFSIALSGCKKDPCKDVTCQNGGTCVVQGNGKTTECDCPEGYSGDFCEVKEPLSGQLSFNITLYNVQNESIGGGSYAAPTVMVNVIGTSVKTSTTYLCHPSQYDWLSSNCVTYGGACGDWTAPCTFRRVFIFGNEGIPNGELEAGTYIVQVWCFDYGGNLLCEEEYSTIGGQAIRVNENEVTQLATIEITLP